LNRLSIKDSELPTDDELDKVLAEIQHTIDKFKGK
jgi:hypothetical protein